MWFTADITSRPVLAASRVRLHHRRAPEARSSDASSPPVAPCFLDPVRGSSSTGATCDGIDHGSSHLTLIACKAGTRTEKRRIPQAVGCGVVADTYEHAWHAAAKTHRPQLHFAGRDKPALLVALARLAVVRLALDADESTRDRLYPANRESRGGRAQQRWDEP